MAGTKDNFYGIAFSLLIYKTAMQDRNVNNKQDKSGEPEQFESDTQRLVRQHMEDKDHVISEEDMKNMQVGMTPPVDGEVEEEITEWQKRVNERDDNKGQQVTPWDTIDPDKT